MSAPWLVTAANGRTGRAILAALGARGVRTRAFIRNPAQAEALKQAGADECVVGNLLEAPDLRSAAEGCAGILYIGPPMHPQELVMAGHAMAAARTHGGLPLVYYSVMHPLRTEVRHHRLKLLAEEQLVESGLPYSIVQPIRYMQHLEPLWKTILAEGVHAMPFNVEVRFNVADLADLAEATARVVSEGERHRYGTYELAGPEPLSQRDMARIIGEVLGKTVEARAVTIEALQAKARAAGADADRIQQMTAMNAHYDRHGFLGNAAVLQMILGRPPTRFRDYVTRLSLRGH